MSRLVRNVILILFIIWIGSFKFWESIGNTNPVAPNKTFSQGFRDYVQSWSKGPNETAPYLTTEDLILKGPSAYSMDDVRQCRAGLSRQEVGFCHVVAKAPRVDGATVYNCAEGTFYPSNSNSLPNVFLVRVVHNEFCRKYEFVNDRDIMEVYSDSPLL